MRFMLELVVEADFLLCFKIIIRRNIMKRIIMMGVVLLVTVQCVYSQEVEIEKTEFEHFFGFSASTVSGAGLSYIRYLNEYYNIKVTGFYYDSKYEKTNDMNEKAFNQTKFLNGGFELRRNIASGAVRNAISQLYFLTGGSFWYKEKKRPFDPDDNELKKIYTVGCGLGVGFILGYKVSINFDLCYQYADWINYGKKYAGLGGGGGFYFCF